MGLALSYSFLLALLVLLPALSVSQNAFISSKATFYSSPDYLGNPRGACGYGEFGRIVNNGDVAAVGRLYRNGTGCGACYQVRCVHPQWCNEDGVNVVVTDHGWSDATDFILSTHAYARLALPNLAAQLMACGSVEVEYRRISCQYPGYNLVFKVTEHSNYPHYLAIVIIYQAGQKDIVAVELWQEDCQEWRGMRKPYGAAWDMENPPKGPLNARLLTIGAEGQAWIQLNGVIPADWKAGVAYDTKIQLF